MMPSHYPAKYVMVSARYIEALERMYENAEAAADSLLDTNKTPATASRLLAIGIIGVKSAKYCDEHELENIREAFSGV